VSCYTRFQLSSFKWQTDQQFQLLFHRHERLILALHNGCLFYLFLCEYCSQVNVLGRSKLTHRTWHKTVRQTDWLTDMVRNVYAPLVSSFILWAGSIFSARRFLWNHSRSWKSETLLHRFLKGITSVHYRQGIWYGQPRGVLTGCFCEARICSTETTCQRFQSTDSQPWAAGTLVFQISTCRNIPDGQISAYNKRHTAENSQCNVQGATKSNATGAWRG
jgi:hypothetical protein